MPRFLGSLLKRKGGKGSSRASFANEEGEIQVIWGIPGQLRDSRSSTILVYTRGIDICWANQVFNVFLPGLVMWRPFRTAHSSSFIGDSACRYQPSLARFG